MRTLIACLALFLASCGSSGAIDAPEPDSGPMLAFAPSGDWNGGAWPGTVDVVITSNYHSPIISVTVGQITVHHPSPEIGAVVCTLPSIGIYSVEIEFADGVVLSGTGAVTRPRWLILIL